MIKHIKLKKVFCILICVMMLFGVSINVSAAGNPYPTRQNVDGDAYYEVPCTWFAWQEAYNRLGIALPAWGNGGDWLANARNAGYSTGNTPRADSLAVWRNGGYGHVAYVTAANGGNTFTVNEGGRTDLDHTSSHGVAYGYRITNAVGTDRPYNPGQKLVGFIYLNKPSISVNFGADKCEPSYTDAYIYTEVRTNVNGSFTQAGITLWDSSGRVIASKNENPGINGSFLKIWYNITQELGVKLQSGKMYKYQFYTVFNGNKYYGPIRTFNTKQENKPQEKYLRLNKTSVTVYSVKNYSTTLKATTNISGTKVWTSSNNNIASVTQNGTILPKAPGYATIRVTVGGYTASCKVKVEAPSMTITSPSITLNRGQSKTVGVRPYPSGAKVTYQSTNTKVATVTSTGSIKGIAKGTARIRVSANGITRYINVTVTDKYLRLNKTSVTVYSVKNYSTTLKATTNISGTKVWTSSNNNIASVTQNGTILPKAPGYATIRVTVSGYTASCKVKVEAPSMTITSPSITLNRGQSKTVGVRPYPSGAKVTYQSTNTKVATVTSTGSIKGIAKGTARIRVSANGITRYINVTVK